VITKEHIKEDLSRAYVTAAGGLAGVLVSINDESHDYGLDVRLEQVNLIPKKGSQQTENTSVRREPSGHMIRLQMKSTVKWEEEDGQIVYDLDADTFNMLVRLGSRTGTVGHLLGLLCLPDDESLWAEFKDNVLLLRRCCYYLKIDGPETQNTTTQRIRIPIANRITNLAISALFDQLTRTGSL
jgi:Domain of unknown function (DUF4365)